MKQKTQEGGAASAAGAAGTVTPVKSKEAAARVQTIDRDGSP